MIVERLAAQYPNVTFDMMPRRERQSFFLTSKIRLSLDYLRYLQNNLREEFQFTGTPVVLSVRARRAARGEELEELG